MNYTQDKQHLKKTPDAIIHNLELATLDLDTAILLKI